MSLWGKIFAILNVVAAAGFVLVAALDWGQRQRWAYEVYRHDLLLAGLPIDAQERDADGSPRIERISPEVLNAIEPASTGSPQAKTQEEEVRRVRQLVDAKINSNEVQGTKGQKLARYLRPLARTARERDELTRLMAAPQEADKAEADLQKRFDRQFDGVAETGADGARHSLQQRKENAARVLLCLGEALHEDPNADYFATPAYRRYVNVVGLAGAAQAADDLSLVTQKMTQESIAARDADLAQFMVDLDQYLYRNQALSDAVERQDRFLKVKKDEVAKARQLVEVRTEQVNDLKKRLADLQGNTQASLAKQAKAEQEVMDRMIELRDTGRKNQELEREIRRLEGVK